MRPLSETREGLAKPAVAKMKSVGVNAHTWRHFQLSSTTACLGEFLPRDRPIRKPLGRVCAEPVMEKKPIATIPLPGRRFQWACGDSEVVNKASEWR